MATPTNPAIKELKKAVVVSLRLYKSTRKDMSVWQSDDTENRFNAARLSKDAAEERLANAQQSEAFDQNLEQITT